MPSGHTNRQPANVVAAGIAISVLALSAQTLADSTIRNAWVARYATPPSGSSASYTNMSNNCNLCHASGGGSNYNAYGWSIRQQIHAGASITQAFINTENLNADGHSGTNLAEIVGSTQPAWTPGPNNTIYTNNSGSTLTNQLPAALAAGTYDLPCPADINGDAQISVNDLLAVINGWGACAPPCPPQCAADVDDNCAVDVIDLLAVINTWGPCP